jgi:hypothetical protein
MAEIWFFCSDHHHLGIFLDKLERNTFGNGLFFGARLVLKRLNPESCQTAVSSWHAASMAKIALLLC